MSAQPQLQQQRELVQDRAVVTREKLLGAALRSFTTVGYEAASTRQIEADAGVNRGLIGYHFKTKEALWKATVEWLFGRAAQELADAERHAANVDVMARLRYFVRALVRFSARFPQINRLMVQEGMHEDWRVDWLVAHYVRPWYQRLQSMFEQAQEAGVAPAMDFANYNYIVTGSAALMFSMASEAKRLAGIDTTDETAINRHADALAQLLFPGGTS